MNQRILSVGFFLSIVFAPFLPAVNQYWDTSTTAGYQHGNGSWSTLAADTNWTLNGTSRCGWTNGNTAYFSGTGGKSVVRVDGSTVNANGGLTVNGTRYDIVVTNGGQLTVSNNFIIGYAVGALSNRVAIVGGEGVTSRCSSLGASWVNYSGKWNELYVDGRGAVSSAVFKVGTLLVGYVAASSSGKVTVCRGGVIDAVSIPIGRASPRNLVTVSDGGIIRTSFYVGIGLVSGNNGSSSNTLVVTGSGSLVASAYLYVGGESRTGNKLIVADGGVVSNINTFSVGGSTSRRSMMVITNGGKLFTSGTISFAGGSSLSTTGLITGAGSTWNLGNGILTLGSGTNNLLQIEDSGLVTNANAIRIGFSATARTNRLVVSGGARLYSKGASSIGYTAGASGNSALVTGAGSLWDLGGQNLTVGAATMPGNSLTIDGTGRVDRVGLLTVATNNTLNIRGGTLVAGQATFQDGAQTVFRITEATTPGSGWGCLTVTNGFLTLGGGLHAVLRPGFLPPGSARFDIMTNQGPGTISGVFSNAAHGSDIEVYAEDKPKSVGLFTVEIGARNVSLIKFRQPHSGSVFMIH